MCDVSHIKIDYQYVDLVTEAKHDNISNNNNNNNGS
jgi:hypothetical protein